MAAAVVMVVLVGSLLLTSVYLRMSVSNGGSSSTSPNGASSALQNSANSPMSTSTVDSTSLFSACSGALIHPYLTEDLHVPAGQELDICVEFYYFSGDGRNATTMRPSDQIAIRSLHGQPANSNFTIAYSTAQAAAGGDNFTVQIGGPSWENEGYLVLYRISPNLTAGVSNGTYIMSFEPWLAPDVLGTPGGQTTTIVTSVSGAVGPLTVNECDEEFALSIGGTPNYEVAAHCFSLTETGTYPAGAEVPRYVPNTLVAAIVGVTTTSVE